MDTSDLMHAQVCQHRENSIQMLPIFVKSCNGPIASLRSKQPVMDGSLSMRKDAYVLSPEPEAPHCTAKLWVKGRTIRSKREPSANPALAVRRARHCWSVWKVVFCPYNAQLCPATFLHVLFAYGVLWCFAHVHLLRCAFCTLRPSGVSCIRSTPCVCTGSLALLPHQG